MISDIFSRDDVIKSTIGEGGYATESYYDDYTPDMDASWQQSPAAADGGDYYGGQGVPPPQQQQQYQQSYDENNSGWSQ